MQPHNNPGIEKRFIISIGLTSLILIAELVGGLWTGSLALLSDSAHVFMDIFALALSFFALRISSRPADDRHSFGYHRLEVLAALANGLTLAIISIGIWWESFNRFANPGPIKSIEMLVIAAIGLVVNVVVALVLSVHSHEIGGNPASKDLNIRSAFLHVVGDAVSSVGVILAAIIISLTGLQWVDPLMSIVIGIMIAWSAFRVLRSSIHILIEGVPEGLSIQSLSTALAATPGVAEVHDLHVWNICSGHISLSAHVVPEPGNHQATLMAGLKQALTTFGIEHTTIQFEEIPCEQSENGCGNLAARLSVVRER